MSNKTPTGWPPGLLQDDSRDLSRALAGKPDAMRHAREAAATLPDPSPDLVERANRARRFPANTCGASRHAQGVAEAMMQGDVLPEVTDDPTHIGESILSTVAALYEARSEITRLRAEVEALRERLFAAEMVTERAMIDASVKFHRELRAANAAEEAASAATKA